MDGDRSDDSDDYKWGIPWVEEEEQKDLTTNYPRLLNTGWLVEDLGIPAEDLEKIDEVRTQLNPEIERFYPKNNPTDWYVLAAGDGDGMSEWPEGVTSTP